MNIPLIALTCLIALVNAAPQADLIQNLPGLAFQYNAPQYSGFLNASQGHYIHYWLALSQSNPSTDPLVLWMNGGPGCSSLTGLLFENGPFHVNHDNKTLFENVYSWNKQANMLFIESPVGVGFSFADDKNYSKSNDVNTAQDNYLALRYFFNTKFPEFQGRPFYITGESYCGVYIPMLAKNVVNGSLTGDFPTNLTGIAIGNGILTEKEQHNSVIDFMYFHGLIGQTLWNNMKTFCCPGNCTSTCNFYGSLTQLNNDWQSDGSMCGNLTAQVSEQMLWWSLNDPYNVYQDCYQKTRANLDIKQSLRHFMKFADQAGQINYGSTDHDNGFSCWGDDSKTYYLRDPNVQSAIHITQNALNKNPKPWAGCSHQVGNTYTRTKYEMQPEMNYLIDHNLPMLIYNGDVDMVCNFLGDEWFMEGIASARKMHVTKPRKQWLYRGQIGGYWKSWKNIDLLTVKGAGHFVPTSRGGPALQMIMNFIRNTGDYNLPSGISDARQSFLTTISPATTTSNSVRQSYSIVSFIFLSIIVTITRF